MKCTCIAHTLNCDPEYDPDQYDTCGFHHVVQVLSDKGLSISRKLKSLDGACWLILIEFA